MASSIRPVPGWGPACNAPLHCLLVHLYLLQVAALWVGLWVQAGLALACILKTAIYPGPSWVMAVCLLVVVHQSTCAGAQCRQVRARCGTGRCAGC
jgi:hypothetical protein